MNNKEEKERLFVFLHGLGNSTFEFENIHNQLKREGLCSKNLTLPFHHSQDEFEKFEINSFLVAFEEMIVTVKNENKNRDIIFVAASISCIALVHTAKSISIDKAVFICPFLGAKKSESKLAQILRKLLPNGTIKRKPRIKKYLDTSKLFITDKFDFKTLGDVNQFAKDLSLSAQNDIADVLTIHSIDDEVSFYNYSAKFHKYCSSGDFVTLYTVPHSCAPLFNAKHFINLMDEHFFAKSREIDTTNIEELKSQYIELNVEHRAWAEKIFRILVGFISLFGFTLYQTLPSVINGESYGIYILCAYSTIIPIYVVINLLYYFYLLRNQYVLNTYVEPVMQNVGYQQLKLSNIATGNISDKYTGYISFLVILLPISICLGAFIAPFYLYPEKLIFKSDNFEVLIWYFVNILLLLIALLSLKVFSFYSKMSLSNSPAVQSRTWRKNQSIFSFITSIRD